MKRHIDFSGPWTDYHGVGPFKIDESNYDKIHHLQSDDVHVYPGNYVLQLKEIDMPRGYLTFEGNAAGFSVIVEGDVIVRKIQFQNGTLKAEGKIISQVLECGNLIAKGNIEVHGNIYPHEAVKSGGDIFILGDICKDSVSNPIKYGKLDETSEALYFKQIGEKASFTANGGIYCGGRLATYNIWIRSKEGVYTNLNNLKVIGSMLDLRKFESFRKRVEKSSKPLVPKNANLLAR